MKESEEQSMLFRWAELSAWRYPELRLMYHCPNGGSRNKIEAARLKNQGVKAGVPDIFLPHSVGEYHGLYIELKTDTGSTTDKQEQWLRDLRAEGYYTDVCHGFEAARAVIEDYLTGGHMNTYKTCETCRHHDKIVWCKKYGDDPKKADKACREDNRTEYRANGRKRR